MITIFDKKWRVSDFSDNVINEILNGKPNAAISQDLLDWLKFIKLIVPLKITAGFSIRTLIEDIQLHVLIDLQKKPDGNNFYRKPNIERIETIKIKIQNKSRFLTIDSVRNTIASFYRDRHLVIKASSEEDAKYLKSIVLIAL